MPLNLKQQAFVREYLVDRNATQAAIRAGYSPKTAGSQAHDLLKKPEVQEAVQEGAKQHAAAVGFTAESVLADIERISRAAEKAGEFNAALKGRELLGKSLKLFTDKLEVEGKLTLEQLVLSSQQKREER